MGAIRLFCGAACAAAASIGISGPARRRRCPRHRPRAAGFAKALGVAVLAAALASPASAVPVVIDNEYDFANGPLGWTSQTVNYLNAPWFVPNQWSHDAAGGFWQVDPVSVINENYWVGNYLTSPVIEVAATIDILEFNMIHRYRFPENITTGKPVVAGQLVYKVFDAVNPNAPYQPFAADAFASGPVEPPFDALTPYSDWVVPTWLAPAGLPPLIAGGMSWVGESPGYESGQWIASRATLLNLVAGQFVEFRLINANLGRECTGGGWDVSYVRVNGFAPEPDGATLAAAGSVISAATYLVRRHRRRRVSTGLPGRS
jgi:hypothetical protein